MVNNYHFFLKLSFSLNLFFPIFLMVNPECPDTNKKGKERVSPCVINQFSITQLIARAPPRK